MRGVLVSEPALEMMTSVLPSMNRSVNSSVLPDKTAVPFAGASAIGEGAAIAEC